MPPKNQGIYVCFTITDSFDPAEITQRLGVQPTEAWRKGDLHPKRAVPRASSRWSLFSCLKRDAELENHVRDVLEQMSQNPQGFQSVSREFGGQIQVVGYYTSPVSQLRFDRTIIEALARFSLMVNLDFDYVASEGRQMP